MFASLGLALLVACRPTVTDEPASKIAFVSSRGGGWGLYVTTVGRDGMDKLTPDDMEVGHFSWSPDGKRIAFEAVHEGRRDIYVVGIDDGHPVRLTDGAGHNRNPDWSPDGERIAFISDRDGTWGLYVMDIDGSDVTRLTDTGTGDYPPRWSPDGRRIAFMHYADNFEIDVVDADGRDPIRLTTSGWIGPRVKGWSAEPEWSPDGQSVTFMSDREGSTGSQIYVVDVDEGHVAQLTHYGQQSECLYPAWSPNGSLIAFLCTDDRGGGIYTLEVGEEEPRRLTDVARVYIHLSWSPDSRYITFESDGDIHVVDVLDGTVVRLTDDEADDRAPSWSP